jgi:hypothetical protein
MIKTFTPNDVLRYAYQETPQEENELIEQMLLTDPAMQAFYQEVVDLQNYINRVRIEPSGAVTSRILEFSRNFPLGE